MQKTTTQINIDLLMRALIKQNDLRFSYAVRAFLLYVKEPVFVQNKEAFFDKLSYNNRVQNLCKEIYKNVGFKRFRNELSKVDSKVLDYIINKPTQTYDVLSEASMFATDTYLENTLNNSKSKDVKKTKRLKFCYCYKVICPIVLDNDEHLSNAQRGLAIKRYYKYASNPYFRIVNALNSNDEKLEIRDLVKTLARSI